MGAIANLRVGARLMLGFAVVLVLLVLVILIGLSRMAVLQGNLDTIVNEDFARVTLVNTMRDAVRFQAVALRDVVMQDDLSFMKGELKQMHAARKKYQVASDALAKMATDAEDQDHLKQIGAAEAAMADAQSQVMDAVLAGDNAGAQASVRNLVRPKQLDLVAKMEDMLKFLEQKSAASAAQATRAYHTALVTMVVLGVVAVLLGGVVAFAITKSITKPLGQAVRVANLIAQGDLTSRVEVSGGGEMGELLRALQDMLAKLSGLIRQVTEASGLVAGATSQLTRSAHEVSAQADQESDQIMQISAALEEMTVAIGEVANGADSVVGASQRTKEVTTDGYDNMTKGSETSRRIVSSVHDSSSVISALSEQIQRISEVTQVIREIADQTNLLALNAAIEAARAGEQGRGFAVVADEVRKLAERTASSTLSISETVAVVESKTDEAVQAMERVTGEVQEGARYTERTREVLGAILESAEEVDRLARHIAEATQEQKTASTSTAVSMEKISTLTERNTANVHSMDRATQEVSQAASQLQALVQQFRV
ncbi:MAG TPA: methyl-accepting chemotaxis protein [Parasulfuritortus sp.]